jgi:hypothetical protein
MEKQTKGERRGHRARMEASGRAANALRFWRLARVFGVFGWQRSLWPETTKPLRLQGFRRRLALVVGCCQNRGDRI